MKKIPLTQGKFALVDDEDFEYLNQWKWKFLSGYAARKKGKKTIYMHRLVNNTLDNKSTDHINMNKSDNRKENLRSSTSSQNKFNRDSMGGSSKYKGVSWNKKREKWVSHTTINYKQIYLGEFDAEIDAAIAYNIAAKKYHGSFARLNQVAA